MDHGLRSVCTLVHISVSGNMNHIAMSFLRDIARNGDNGEEWLYLVFDVLRETSRERKVLQIVYSMLVSCCIYEGVISVAMKLISRMRKLNFFLGSGVYGSFMRGNFSFV